MKIIQRIVLAAGLGFLNFNADAQAPPFLTNGLVAYFPFNGFANDESGNGNDGKLFGQIAFGVDRFGNSNSCLALPGTAGTGSGVDVPSLSDMAYSPVTYSAWFLLSNYPPSLPSDFVVMTLLGREQCGDQSQGAIALTIPNGGGQSNLVYYYGAGGFYPPALIVPTNQWCQVVVTIGQTGTPTFYFNGTNLPIIGSAPSGQPLDFRIGVSVPGQCSTGRFVWNGLIDDVRVYHLALSASEVGQLYQYESQYEAQCIPYPATAVATVTNGFVVGATVIDGGCGYTNTPVVLIQGGGGAGAMATAVVSNGVLADIIVTSAGSNYTSIPAVYIYWPFEITAQPQSLVVHAHTNASFSVTATGTAPLSYQWLFDGANILGATSNSFAISNVVQTNLGTYAVVVTNAFGTNVSSGATLSMYPFLTAPFDGLDTDWGYTNILSVNAWGTGPLSFQWYQNGVALEGATNQTLDFVGIQFTNAGLYSVVVSNPLGSVTNTPEEVVVNPAGVTLGGLYPGVLISGVVGYSYLIQSTTNLSNTNSWFTVTNLTLSQPTQLWVDSNTDAALPRNPQRFYQVLPGQ